MSIHDISIDLLNHEGESMIPNDGQGCTGLRLELFQKGIGALERALYQEAFQIFDALKGQGANIAGLNLYHAVSLVALERYDEAVISVQEELMRDPGDQDAKELLASIRDRRISGIHNVGNLDQTLHASFDRMRFMQVDTAYSSVYEDLYARNPSLVNRSYEEQMDALFENGFAGIHLFPPYLELVGYEGRWVLANCLQAQARWAQENGLRVTRTGWTKEILRAQIEAFRPQVLYTTNPFELDSTFIRSLSYRPELVMAWRGADIPDNTDWSAFDVILSGLTNVLNAATVIGAGAGEHFFPGYPSWMNTKLEGITQRYDVVFVGSCVKNQHATRNDYLTELAKASERPEAPFTCVYHLNGKTDHLSPEVRRHAAPSAFGIQMLASLKRARIIVDARANHKWTYKGQEYDLGGEDTINMRLFEAAGAGVFILTEYFEGVKRYFEPGLEVETFRDADELVAKIRYYLDHPEEREAIARRAQVRCLTEYSIENRALAFDAIIKKHLDRKRGQANGSDLGDLTRTKAHEDLSALIEQGARALEMEDFERALACMSRVKSLGIRMENVDYIRATCFHRLNRIEEARAAISEELQSYPNNRNAAEFLNLLTT